MLLSSYPAGTAATQQAGAGANCIKPSEGRTEDTLVLEHHKPDKLTHFGSAYEGDSSDLLMSMSSIHVLFCEI